MKKLQFSIDIDAPKEKIWKTLWDDATYRQWTSVFHEGSYAETDWKEGSQVLFLGPDGTGMYSMVERNTPNELMSFKHLGVTKNGKPEPLDEETKQWSGAMETYTLQEMGESTRVTVDMDIAESHQDYFKESFPKALAKVKEIAEK